MFFLPLYRIRFWSHSHRVLRIFIRHILELISQFFIDIVLMRNYDEFHSYPIVVVI